LLLDKENQMPPPKEKKQLTKEQIALIKQWIKDGADWPDAAELK
jgi:hypothetical protein